MKKLSVLMMLLILFFVASNFETAQAAQADIDGHNQSIKNFVDGTVLSDQEIDLLLKSSTEYTIKLSPEQVLKDYAEEYNLSEEEASREINSYLGKKYNSPATAGYNQPKCNWYITNTIVKFNSKSSYNNGQQTLQVYLDVCTGGSVGYIHTSTPPLMQKFIPTSHNFQGDIVVILYNGHFQYSVSGKFYSDGTTSHLISFGATAPYFTAGYSVGTANNSLGTAMVNLAKRDVFGY